MPNVIAKQENENSKQAELYQTIANAITYLKNNVDSQPTLSCVARSVNMSESHFQKVFSEWAGISPKRFLQVLTKHKALAALKSSQNILDAALESGLSGTGRLHDLMVSCEALTPGELKRNGEGIEISWGKGVTPFGLAVIGWTSRGICFLQFVDNNLSAIEQLLIEFLPEASLVKMETESQKRLDIIFDRKLERGNIHLLLKGTNFQVKVWEALLSLPENTIYSYGQVATLVGNPNASRAVGSAVGANNIGYLIPCHRVINQTGELGKYRWGETRKQLIQCWESL